MIEGGVENVESRRKEKFGTAYELWARTFPRDDEPPIALWLIYAAFGEPEKSRSAAQEGLSSIPEVRITS
jgi:hypothetical protein